MSSEPKSEDRNHWRSLADEIGAEVPDELEDYFGGTTKLPDVSDDLDAATIEIEASAAADQAETQATAAEAIAAVDVSTTTESTKTEKSPRKPARRRQRKTRASKTSEPKKTSDESAPSGDEHWSSLASSLGIEVPQIESPPPQPDDLSAEGPDVEIIDDAFQRNEPAGSERGRGADVLSELFPAGGVTLPESEPTETAAEQAPQTDADADNVSEPGYIEFEVEELTTEDESAKRGRSMKGGRTSSRQAASRSTDR